MSGLLDKASGYSDSVHQGDNVESKIINEPSAIIDAYEKGKSAAGDGLLAKAGADSGGSPELATKVSSGGGLDDEVFPMAKWGVIGAAALLVLFIFYQVIMGFNLGGYSFTFTDVDISEEDNNLRLKLSVGTPLFGGVSGDDIDLSISYGGEEVWTGFETIDSSNNWFEIPIADFYQGNVRDGTGFNNHNFYIVTATQGDTTTEYTIMPESLLDRTLTDASGDVRTISENGDCPDSDGTNGKCHVGAQFTLILGRDDPVNTGSMWHVDSDYTVSVSVEYHSDGTGTFSTVFDYPQITVNGWLATWGGKAGVESGGTSVEESLMYMGGGNTDTFSKMPYLEREYFYEDDGCYRLAITVQHTGSDTTSFSDTSPGTLLSWEYNEQRNGDNEDYRPDESC